MSKLHCSSEIVTERGGYMLPASYSRRGRRMAHGDSVLLIPIKAWREYGNRPYWYYTADPGFDFHRGAMRNDLGEPFMSGQAYIEVYGIDKTASTAVFLTHRGYPLGQIRLRIHPDEIIEVPTPGSSDALLATEEGPDPRATS